MGKSRVGKHRFIKSPSEPRRITLKLEDIAHLGEAVGRHDGRVIFASYGIPGEEVEVELDEEKTSYAYGHVVDVVTPSPLRVKPNCPHFGECGGCNWQHIDYQAQLEYKRKVLAHSLRRIGHFEDIDVSPVQPSPQWEYRNQARFSAKPNGMLGFNRRRTHRLLPVDWCHLVHPAINETLQAIQGRCQGVKHQVIVRHGLRTGQTLIYPRLPVDDVRSGQEGLEEELLGRRFWVSSQAFFQVNTIQAERLASQVIDMVGLCPDGLVIDAYCGVGTFALLLAGQGGRVIGIEESVASVAAAKRNAATGENVEFLAGKVEDVLPQLEQRADTILLDPPRAGCHPNVLNAVLKTMPGKVVYVSCEPATLARDLRILVDGGYEIKRIQPVDMFPQTYHIETVTLLQGRHN